MWLGAATVVLDAEGRYLEADHAALDLLGVASLAELQALPPNAFTVDEADPDEQAALRAAYAQAAAVGVLAEGAFRRIDGELVRVRMAILPEPIEAIDVRYRVLFFPLERPTRNTGARIFTIADVLGEWRAAERRLVALDTNTVEAQEVADQIAQLRAQYRVLFDMAR